MPVPAEEAAVVTTSGSNPTEGIKKLKIKVKSFPHLKEVVIPYEGYYLNQRDKEGKSFLLME